jgi:hypothetical protein
VNTTVPVPVTVALSDIAAIPEFALVIVTSTGDGGELWRLRVTDVCRFLPTEIVLKPQVMLGAVTVAVIDWKLLGVEKPAGATTLTVEVPALVGSNWVVPELALEAKVTGLVVIVPTEVLELVTVTSAVNPPRKAWFAAQLRVEEFNRAGVIWTLVLPENVVVEMLPGELMIKPEGSTVTLALPVLYPAAVEERLALPRLRPCT